MAFEIVHNVENGVRQLLEAPGDIADLVPEQGQARPLAEATEEHRRLYRLYLSDFAVAYELGDDWWEGCVTALEEDGHRREEANRLAYENRLAGPTSAPEVVWFFRKYWLAFDEVNRGLSATDRIPPQFALLGWLVEERRDDYVRFLTCMPYWPIGLDADGNWC